MGVCKLRWGAFRQSTYQNMPTAWVTFPDMSGLWALLAVSLQWAVRIFGWRWPEQFLSERQTIGLGHFLACFPASDSMQHCPLDTCLAYCLVLGNSFLAIVHDSYDIPSCPSLAVEVSWRNCRIIKSNEWAQNLRKSLLDFVACRHWWFHGHFLFHPASQHKDIKSNWVLAGYLEIKPQLTYGSPSAANCQMCRCWPYLTLTPHEASSVGTAQCDLACPISFSSHSPFLTLPNFSELLSGFPCHSFLVLIRFFFCTIPLHIAIDICFSDSTSSFISNVVILHWFFPISIFYV